MNNDLEQESGLDGLKSLIEQSDSKINEDENIELDQISDSEEGLSQEEKIPLHTYDVAGETKPFDPVFQNENLSPKALEKLTELYQNAETQTLETAKYQELESKNTQFENALGHLEEMAKKDLDGLFQTFDIDKDRILEYAVKEIKHRELPENERNSLEKTNQGKMENAQLLGQVSDLKDQMAEQQYTHFQNQFDQEINKPEVIQFANNIDNLLHKEGSFKNAVINFGKLKQAENEVVNPHDAIHEIMNMYQGLIEKSKVAPQVPSAIKQTIPSIEGSSLESPVVKKKFSSLDEMRTYANQLN